MAQVSHGTSPDCGRLGDMSEGKVGFFATPVAPEFSLVGECATCAKSMPVWPHGLCPHCGEDYRHMRDMQGYDEQARKARCDAIYTRAINDA